MNPEMQDELYDIYDLWYQPWHENRYFLALAIVGGCCLLILLVWFFYKKNKPTKPLTLQEKVFKRLEEMNFEDMQEAYCALTSTLKLYISEKYDLHVDHKTDLEMQNSVVEIVDEKYGLAIREIFKRASDVKFGTKYISGEELQKDVTLTMQFVQETFSKQSVGE